MESNIKIIVVPTIIAMVAAAGLLILRAVAFRLLHRWGEKTETRLDDLIIEVLKTPTVYWCVAIGLYIGIAVSGLPEKYAFYISKTVHVIVIFSITMAAANIAGR